MNHSNSSKLTKNLLYLLSLQGLISTAHADTLLKLGNSPSEFPQVNSKYESNLFAQRIMQKRIVGFDPKQAVETLSALKGMGISKFEKDGTVIVASDKVAEITDLASVENLEIQFVQIPGLSEMIKMRFKAVSDPGSPQKGLNPMDKLRAANLASHFKLKCDMDGKMVF